MANTQALGVIQRQDGARTVEDVGQQTVYNATVLDIAAHNARVQSSLDFFVQGDTDKYQFNYFSRSGGELQETGLNSPPAEMQGGFKWAVGFPIRKYEGAVGTNDITYAHLTVNEWAQQVNGVFDADVRTVRRVMLKALFNKLGMPNWVGQIYPDETAVNVMPLANGDTTLYPPAQGATSPSTRNHYLGVPADASTLTNSNNPIPRATALLKQAYGAPPTGAPIVTFLNSAQVASAMDLATFVDASAYFINPGPDSATLKNLPANLPGNVVGATPDSLLVEWDQIPAGYTFSTHLSAPKPLLRRLARVASLGKNLQLVAEEREYPIRRSFWRNIFGFGAAERTNGVVIDLTAAGGANTYTTPTAFA